MEILLWLVPPAVVTLVAMVWVGWLGRQERREVDREKAVRRLGEALSEQRLARRPTGAYAPRLPKRRDRSTGVAVRRTPPLPTEESPPTEEPPADPPAQERRAG